VGDEAGQLDLNRATTEELQRLPGIGPTLAGQIVRARERRGRFAAPEDLRAVPGIGPKKFEGIRDLITVREGRGAEGRAGDGAREAEGGVGDSFSPAIPAPPRPQPPDDIEIREFQGQ
jgi:competence ComEA-like helix-hairpin-helix protein